MKYGLSESSLEAILSVFRERQEVDEVILFGSRAKGTYRSGSDIDLAVKGNLTDFNNYLKLLIKLEELDLLYKIDLVNFDSIDSVELLDHISRIGIKIYERE